MPLPRASHSNGNLACRWHQRSEAQIGTAMDEMLAIANAHLTGQTRDNFIRAQIRVMEAVADLSRSALLSTMSSLKQVLEQKLELDACKAELNRTTY